MVKDKIAAIQFLANLMIENSRDCQRQLKKNKVEIKRLAEEQARLKQVVKLSHLSAATYIRHAQSLIQGETAK